MNFTDPSRLYPVTAGTRERDDEEEDLTRMVDQLNLENMERSLAVYGTRKHPGDVSDREVDFGLLIHNAGEFSVFNTDWELPQRLAEGGGERDPTPRPATRVQPAVVRPPQSTMIRKWGKRVASFFSMTVSSSPTVSNHNKATTTTANATPYATGHYCVVCRDPIFEAEVRAPCGHFYDIGCVTNLFQLATRDESLYPPQCCRKNIPFSQLRPHLTQALLVEFELKSREFGTLRRVYCASPVCSRFLGPRYQRFFGKVFTCPSHTCITKTCGQCRGSYEGRSHKCTPDAESERVLALGRASGWSRCPRCSQMIELQFGCHHVTCRCKKQFCYLCRARWKSCWCPLQPVPVLEVLPAAQEVPAVPIPVPAADPALNKPIL